MTLEEWLIDNLRSMGMDVKEAEAVMKRVRLNNPGVAWATPKNLYTLNFRAKLLESARREVHGGL